MKYFAHVQRAFFTFTILVLLVANTVGCEPGEPGVVYKNETSQRVSVYEAGAFGFSVDRGESKRIALRSSDWVPDIRVVGDDGTVLLDDHITWDEVEEMDHTITIRGEVSTPG